MQVDSEVVKTIVEMEVSTAESPDKNEHNRIYPGASKEGRSSSEVDEISEEAEYRNIPGEDGTPEYENEARIEDGEDGRLGSKTDVSTGSAAPIKPPKNRNYTVLDASTRDNPGPPSIYKRLKSKPFNPNSTKQPVTCIEADKSPFDSGRCGMLQHRKSQTEVAKHRSRVVWVEVRTDDVLRMDHGFNELLELVCSVNTISWITIMWITWTLFDMNRSKYYKQTSFYIFQLQWSTVLILGMIVDDQLIILAGGKLLVDYRSITWCYCNSTETLIALVLVQTCYISRLATLFIRASISHRFHYYIFTKVSIFPPENDKPQKKYIRNYVFQNTTVVQW